MTKRLPDRERFWSRVIVIEDDDSCWPITNTKTGEVDEGYGIFVLEGERLYAHQASYILNIGPIPEGKFVCHSCDWPPCIRPKHLWTGTNSENIKDSVMKGRSRSPEHLKKLAAAIQKRWSDPEQKRKQSELMKRLHAEGKLTVPASICLGLGPWCAENEGGE